jgi:hypothetical protein
MVLSGNLYLLQDELPQALADDPAIMKNLQDSQQQVNKITAVIRILQRVTNVEQAAYHGQVKMIDIEAALKKELAQE